MLFHYQAYGIPIISDVKLPALIPNNKIDGELKPLNVSLGKVADTLINTPTETKPFSSLNQTEFRFALPNVGKYYVANGTEIIIEPLSDNWNEVLLHFYANCLAAALLQRNIIPFHVSGVILPSERVVLFAAPSRTGKSTTAIKLQERGYAPFTDDTAILEVERGIASATASYPMARLWQNTIEVQSQYDEADKQMIFAELNKYGFGFHERFVSTKVPVAAIVFLEEAGTQLSIEKLSPAKCMQFMGQNMYRRQWVTGMEKQRLQFEILSSLAHTIPAYKAIRPKDKPTFEAFAASIDNQILKNL